MSKVIIRPFNKETDTGLIYEAYPKGVWHGAAQPIKMSKALWFRRFFLIMKSQLEESTNVRIACMDDDRDSILGFSVIEERELQFVFVKYSARNNGIGNLLTSRRFDSVNPQTLTKLGALILNRREEKEEHGRNHPEENKDTSSSPPTPEPQTTL